jgi:Ras-related protein Rab-4B
MLESIKIVVVGASGAGKTALLHRLLGDDFSPEFASTIGVEFISYRCEIDGIQTKLQIWDTAGQERFKSVTRSYLRGALGALLVFDLTNRISFESVSDWLHELEELSHPNSVVLLVGNKFDLVEKREIVRSECNEFADNHRLDFIETSALTGMNVREAFLRVAHEIIVRQQKGIIVVQRGLERPILSEVPEKRCNC